MPRRSALLLAAAVLAAAALLLATCPACQARRPAAEPLGPLDPGVRVDDPGSARQKCVDCERELGRDGSKPKCLTCTQPRFRYLMETIEAESGATRACPGCRGAP